MHQITCIVQTELGQFHLLRFNFCLCFKFFLFLFISIYFIFPLTTQKVFFSLCPCYSQFLHSPPPSSVVKPAFLLPGSHTVSPPSKILSLSCIHLDSNTGSVVHLHLHSKPVMQALRSFLFGNLVVH